MSTMDNNSFWNSLQTDRYEDRLKLIWDYLAISERPRLADAIFVFGGIDLHVPHHAANLYIGSSDLSGV